jgi:hypothetical protein
VASHPPAAVGLDGTDRYGSHIRRTQGEKRDSASQLGQADELDRLTRVERVLRSLHSVAQHA